MADENRKLPDQEFVEAEPGPQPDPMLQASEGRASPVWKWFAGLVIVFVVTLVFYALNSDHSEVADNSASPSAGTSAPAATDNAPPPPAPTDARGKSQ
jgi:hypothetical protein